MLDERPGGGTGQDERCDMSQAVFERECHRSDPKEPNAR